MQNKKVIIIAVLIAVILGGLLLFFLYKKNILNNDTENKVASPPAKVLKTNVDFASVPEGFPLEVPIEEGARITQNYNATNSSGNFQATRAFETTQSLEVNLSLYKAFLESNGWEIQGTTDKPQYKMIIGANGKKSIQVTIDENQYSKIKTVTITYSEVLK